MAIIKTGHPNQLVPESLLPGGKRSGMNSELLKQNILAELALKGFKPLPPMEIEGQRIPNFEDMIDVISTQIIKHIQSHAYVSGFNTGLDTNGALHETVLLNDFTTSVQ